MKAAPPSKLAQCMPWLLIIGGVIGIICAFIISYDKIQILQHANYRPSCDLNPIISCGSVMSSRQGSAFGFPNPWVGLAAFAVLVTIGMAMLAGGKFKRWFWMGLEVGSVFGIGFVHWLFFESVYRIHALCPYCMVVWVVTITTFWYVTLYNIETGVITLKQGTSQKLGLFARKHHLDILVFWLLIILALILKHFWYYYGKHL